MNIEVVSFLVYTTVNLGMHSKKGCIEENVQEASRLTAYLDP